MIKIQIVRQIKMLFEYQSERSETSCLKTFFFSVPNILNTHDQDQTMFMN